MPVGRVRHVEWADAVGSAGRGRPRRRRSLVPSVPLRVAAALVVSLGLVLVGACGSDGSRGPAEGVSLARLSAHQADLAGLRVTTTGTVRRFGHGPQVHYVIEDAAQHRVGIEPASLVADRIGLEVTVTGEFVFDETTGRRIEADSVRPAK